MADIGLLKLLVDKKVADAFQFFTSCQYKLDMAELSYNALKNLIDKYQEEEADIVNKVFEDAKKTGKGTYKLHKNIVDFFGIEIDTTVAIEKLFMEIMGLLHNFFDTYAQWINSSLFGERALPIKRASLINVIGKMPDFPEYSDQFITDFINIMTNRNYIYVSDFNNTQKHRYQLYIQNKFDILNVQGEVSVPNFGKDGRVHIKTDVLNVVTDCLNYCRKLLDDSESYIEKYYSSNDCNYIEHRIYNPKTYIFFENEDDYRQMKNAKNHYHYIEVDTSSILPQYQIMIVRNSNTTENDENKNIEMFNSVYPIIMLKDVNTENIVGILKPEDEETYNFGDEHNLIYRKYRSITSNYQHEMFAAICSSDFHYYPYLSDAIIIYGTESDENQKSE